MKQRKANNASTSKNSMLKNAQMVHSMASHLLDGINSSIIYNKPQQLSGFLQEWYDPALQRAMIHHGIMAADRHPSFYAGALHVHPAHNAIFHEFEDDMKSHFPGKDIIQLALDYNALEALDIIITPQTYPIADHYDLLDCQNKETALALLNRAGYVISHKNMTRAVKMNNLELLYMLGQYVNLDQDINISGKSVSPEHALSGNLAHIAAYEGHFDIFQELVTHHGIDLNAPVKALGTARQDSHFRNMDTLAHIIARRTWKAHAKLQNLRQELSHLEQAQHNQPASPKSGAPHTAASRRRNMPSNPVVMRDHMMNLRCHINKVEDQYYEYLKIGQYLIRHDGVTDQKNEGEWLKNTAVEIAFMGNVFDLLKIWIKGSKDKFYIASEIIDTNQSLYRQMQRWRYEQNMHDQKLRHDQNLREKFSVFSITKSRNTNKNQAVFIQSS